MNVHVFGGTLSSSSSNYKLQRTATDHETRYGKKVADTLREHVFDDLLKSVQDKQTAIKLMKGMKVKWAEGELHLAKFISNSQDVLLSILEEKRRKGLQDQELRLRTLPTEKTLSTLWSIEEDKLSFNVRFKHQPDTKRVMLLMESSIHDPLIFVFPSVLEWR